MKSRFAFAQRNFVFANDWAPWLSPYNNGADCYDCCFSPWSLVHFLSILFSSHITIVHEPCTLTKNDTNTNKSSPNLPQHNTLSLKPRMSIPNDNSISFPHVQHHTIPKSHLNDIPNSIPYTQHSPWRWNTLVWTFQQSNHTPFILHQIYTLFPCVTQMLVESMALS